MRTHRSGMLLLLGASLQLSACSGAQGPSLTRCEPGNCPLAVDTGSLIFVLGAHLGRTPNDAVGALAINAYLWRGALDTFSAAPLTSADPLGGVIITDWYTPPNAPDEHFKSTVLIVGRELRTRNLRISVLRQVLRDGRWTDARVSPQAVEDLQDKVLSRARQLRLQAGAKLVLGASTSTFCERHTAAS